MVEGASKLCMGAVLGPMTLLGTKNRVDWIKLSTHSKEIPMKTTAAVAFEKEQPLVMTELDLEGVDPNVLLGVLRASPRLRWATTYS